MSYRQIFFHSFSFLTILSIFVFLIPQTEQSDGMLHYANFKKKINDFNFSFKSIYFYMLSWLDFFYIFLGFENFCLSDDVIDPQYCFGAHDYSDEVKRNLKIFGINIPLMQYKYKFAIFSFQLSLITLNFLLFLITIISFKIIKLEKSMIYLIIIFFFMPSVLTAYSYVSPNTISIFFHLFVFINLINKKYVFTIILIFFSIYLDKQNIILAFVFFNFIIILSILKKYNNITGYLLFIFSSILISFLFIIITKIYIPDSDLTYLTQSGFQPIKSFLTMYISLYYLGGSMSYLSFEIEYLFYILFIIIFIFLNIKSSKIKLSLHLTIFIAINIAFFQVLTALHSVDQGRYYIILLLNLIYFFITEYKKIFINNFHLIIFTIYMLNMMKVIKQYFSIYA